MVTRRALIATGFGALAAPALAAGLDPKAAHARALAAIRAANARADVLLRGQGLARGTAAERFRTLFADSRFLYPDDDAGRDRAVADMNARLAALKPRLPVAFGELAIPPAEVRRMSAADVAAGKGGYREIGHYYVDLRTIRERPAWTLPSVAFHEVTPGHLLHLPTNPAAQTTPLFEGWATYAEQLARDLGAYAADPLGEIGYLHWRLFRLVRVVVDTGLSSFGWSRDRAVAEMTAVLGHPIAFIGIEADVDRIAKAPGKVAAEGLAALGLAAARPRDRSRWPAFHRNALLACV
jgi:uncharacterized protein (DUF885 family)